MSKALVIKLLEGLNELEFGMPKEDFLEKMGPAVQEETISEEDEAVQTVLLEYPDWETSFFFEGKAGKFYLNSCDSTNKGAELFGLKIFEMSKDELVQLFKNMGFENYETKMEEWGEMRLTFENSMADLYFENRKLSSIIWGY